MKNISIIPFFVFTLLVFFSTPKTQAQVHQTNTGKEVSLLGFGIGGLTIGHFLDRNTQELEEDYVKALEAQYKKDSSFIFFLDRGTPKRSSFKAASFSDKFLGASTFLPLGLFANEPSAEEAGTVGLMWAETFLITGALTNLVKKSVKRNRPFVFNGEPLPSGYDKFDKDARFSFFSGHTSISAASSFFTAQVFAHNNPDSNMRPVFWTTAAVFPAVTGFLRQRAGKHFWTDVIVGYAVGAAVGILVPKLHK